MPRFEIDGDPIRVAFGSDPHIGVFLSVFDKRLKYDPQASDAVNRVTEAIGVKDGGGSYFDLHTGQFGFGIKVDDPTMRTYLRRFGVPDEQISELLPALEASPRCTECARSTSQRCSKCHTVSYCSRRCQTKDWPVHKLFCQLPFNRVGFSEKSDKTVVAVLLPEKDRKPILVRIPQKWESDDCGSGWVRDTDPHVKAPQNFIFSDCYEKTYDLSPALCICCKDDFLVDGVSSPNICAKYLVSKSNPAIDSYWKGNLLLFRAGDRSGYERKFEDMRLCDVRDAIFFLAAFAAIVQEGA